MASPRAAQPPVATTSVTKAARTKDRRIAGILLSPPAPPATMACDGGALRLDARRPRRRPPRPSLALGGGDRGGGGAPPVDGGRPRALGRARPPPRPLARRAARHRAAAHLRPRLRL